MGVIDGVGVTLGVGVGVTLGVTVGVTEGVTEGVGVGVGLKSNDTNTLVSLSVQVAKLPPSCQVNNPISGMP